LGLIFSLSNLVWSPLQLGFGVLGRYCSRKLILGLGHVCQGMSIIGTSLVHGFGDLLSWRIIGRIADAPQHPIGNALISQGFRADRRGLALAINAAGSNLGTVAVPLLGGFLIATLGWRSTLILFGLPGVLIGLLLLTLLRRSSVTRSGRCSGIARPCFSWHLMSSVPAGVGWASPPSMSPCISLKAYK
jgi:DHA2 family methylenomycin A resistance protein-like MFS transporter